MAGRKKQNQELFVFMNGVAVGALISESLGTLKFRYAESWLSHKLKRPISLSLPLSEKTYTGPVVRNFFDNLLPDNDVIRERIQVRFQAKSKSCFDLLSHIGADCVGALQILTTPESNYTQSITAEPISNASVAKLLKQYQSAPLGMAENTDFRISIAGAQEKTALLWHKEAWHRPQATTPTSHIIKLPIGYNGNIDLRDSVENEWLCLQILSAYGLPVTKANITTFGKTKTLCVERFDRRWVDKNIIRLPQEDLCQALGFSSGLKYEFDGGPGIIPIMQCLQGAHDAKKDREQFMRSVFLFWVLGAIDGHAKNFSILLGANGQYGLTPLYDVISAYPLAAKRQIPWQRLKMAMAVRASKNHYRWQNIFPRHWMTTAQACQFPAQTMQNIIEETFDTLPLVIERVSEKIPKNFPVEISSALFDGMKKARDRAR